MTAKEMEPENVQQRREKEQQRRENLRRLERAGRARRLWFGAEKHKGIMLDGVAHRVKGLARKLNGYRVELAERKALKEVAA